MYKAIMMVFDTLPLPSLALGLLVITMIAFYSTTLDGITYEHLLTVTKKYLPKRSLLAKSVASGA
ncbi:hypothetical protein, partial [Xylanibacter rodentium]|uniref:hypothetical protein n=1 Tax=Xylanibacter rodentium TaxID=2736289 RepID=UPI002599CC15